MKIQTFILSLVILATSSVKLFTQESDAVNENDFRSKWKEYTTTRMVSDLVTAYEFGESDFQMVKFSLKPEVKVNFHKNFRFTGIGRFYGELRDNLEPGRPDQDAISKGSRRLFIGNRFEVELREFYFDLAVGKRTNFRFGKQQIVWGETDGIKLLDVVNPQYFREFMLEKSEDSRIPLWAVKTDFYIKKINMELLWVPDLSYSLIPDFDTPYFPIALFPQPSEGLQFDVLQIDKPDHMIHDSDIGTKVSSFIGGWGLTLNYLYHYDNLPVIVRTENFNPDGIVSISMQPQCRRMHTIGSTLNNAFGPVTLRGEFAYNIDRKFIASSFDDTDGIIESDQFLIAAGLDWQFNNTMFSFQIFNDILTKDVDVHNRNRSEVNFSFFATQNFINNDLNIELMFIQNLNVGDGMIRTKASYNILSNLILTLGSDIFYGKENGVFGQYQNRSSACIGVEWGI